MWRCLLAPVLNQRESFVQGLASVSARHVSGMNPIAADDFLHGARRVSSGYRKIQKVIGSDMYVRGNAAQLGDGGSPNHRRTHGDEAASTEQLVKDVAFRERSELVKGIVVSLPAARREANGS